MGWIWEGLPMRSTVEIMRGMIMAVDTDGVSK